jgi:small GTP-binding protein
MIQKKICMLGGFAVGKTSLVRQFVESIYSDKYHTTVGVKIDKKLVSVGDNEVNLLLWDIQGEDGVQKLRSSYLRGAAGYLLVIDGTRGTTLDTACAIQQSAQEVLGLVPFIAVINKIDLVDEWDLDEKAVEGLVQAGWTVYRTSAKTGQHVENAFINLAKKITEG